MMCRPLGRAAQSLKGRGRPDSGRVALVEVAALSGYIPSEPFATERFASSLKLGPGSRVVMR